jgi:16S rRNA (uracil1498-N3)-methyltransferase
MAPGPRHVWVDSVQVGVNTLDDETAHHLRRVLRLSPGSEVVLFTGTGSYGHGKWIESEGRDVLVELETLSEYTPQGPQVTVATCAPKGDRADWLVEKLTELGVHTITWLSTARSVTQTHKGSKKAQRWLRIARNSAQQCQGLRVPIIEDFVSLHEFSRRSFDTKLVADPSASATVRPGAPAGTRIAMVVGPEGGLERAELEMLRSAGYTLVGLSNNVLRTETAAVVGAAMLLGKSQGSTNG